MCSDKTAGFNCLLSRDILTKHSHIINDGTGEEEWFLLNQTHDPMKFGLRQLPNIGTINFDTALVYIIKAIEQGDQGAFSSACCAHDPYHFTWIEVQVHLLDQGPVCPITKRHIIKINLAHHILWFQRGGHTGFGISNFGPRIQNVPDAIH
ncbi:hypothetical protein D3C74_330510 [compost metagenome]